MAQSFNPGAIGQSESLFNMFTRNYYSQLNTLDNKESLVNLNQIMPFGTNWRNKEWVEGGERHRLAEQAVEDVDKRRKDFHLTRPYSYQIPQEQQQNIAKFYTTEKGRLVSDAGTLGQRFVGPEEMKFYQAEYERALVTDFDNWVMKWIWDQCTTPVKREYWKKREPEYWARIMQGMRNDLEANYEIDKILLNDPQNDEDWLKLYMSVYDKNRLNKYMGERTREQEMTQTPFPQTDFVIPGGKVITKNIP